MFCTLPHLRRKRTHCAYLVAAVFKDLLEFTHTIDGLRVGDVVGLPGDVGEAGETAIYIREDYITILAMWVAAVVGGGIQVIGTPGIGKSMLGRLVVALEVAKKESVLWVQASTARLFHEGNVYEVNHVDEVGRLGLRYIDVVMVYDRPTGMNKFCKETGSVTFKRAFAVQSPSADFNGTSKAGNMAEGVRFVADPLSLQEAEQVLAAMQLSPLPDAADAAASLGDVAELRSKFAICGGSLRMLVKNKAGVIDDIEEGKSKLLGKGIDGLSMAATDSAIGGDDGKKCHRILHMWRKPQRNGGYGFEAFEEDILRELARNHAKGLLGMVNQVDIHGSLRGVIWENRLHAFCRENKVFSSAADLLLLALVPRPADLVLVPSRRSSSSKRTKCTATRADVADLRIRL